MQQPHKRDPKVRRHVGLRPCLSLLKSKYFNYEHDINFNMKKEVGPICLCPLDGVIDTIGKKWSLLVINEIGNHQKLRFNELMHELRGISPSTLTTTLKELENRKMITKEMFREIPPRVEYSLSPRGKEMRQAIMPLLRWATKKGNYTVHCQCSLIKK